MLLRARSIGDREGFGERLAERAGFALDATRSDQEAREIFPSEQAMPEPREALREGLGIVGGAGGAGTDTREELLELASNGADVPERAARRHERHQLTVFS